MGTLFETRHPLKLELGKSFLDQKKTLCAEFQSWIDRLYTRYIRKGESFPKQLMLRCRFANLLGAGCRGCVVLVADGRVLQGDMLIARARCLP